MSDHLVELAKMVCVHCGLPFSKRQSEIDCYSCGSSYCETFKPQWARSMTCLEMENGQLQEMFRKANLHALDLADRIKRLEEAGDELLSWIPVDWVSDSNRRLLSNAWTAAKEAKP